jgi:hypothetical protein
VKGRLSLLLLLGALLGLFGQQAAYAGGPALAPKMEVSHAMPSGMDCPEMKDMATPTHKEPCKGLTLACIAQMGCVIPMTLTDRLSVPTPSAIVPLGVYKSVVPLLAGRDIVPEPEPPSRLS